MERGKLILITGGARSGKSRLAEELAAKLAGAEGRVIYLATAGVKDEEMRQRVIRHQQRRPARWETVEEELRAEKVIGERGADADVILLDCLALLAANWLLQSGPPGIESQTVWEDQERLAEEIEKPLLSEISTLAETAHRVKSHVIVVTNEVGLGLVPDNPLGRVYRDLLGLGNQIVADKADEVYVVWSGIPLKIKG